MRPDEAREIVSAQRAASSGLLSVARVTITGAVSRALADVRTSLRVAVPAHSLFVIDAAIRVQPDDGIARTVRLRSSFGCEKLERTPVHGSGRDFRDDAAAMPRLHLRDRQLFQGQQNRVPSFATRFARQRIVSHRGIVRN